MKRLTLTGRVENIEPCIRYPVFTFFNMYFSIENSVNHSPFHETSLI